MKKYSFLLIIICLFVNIGIVYADECDNLSKDACTGDCAWSDVANKCFVIGKEFCLSFDSETSCETVKKYGCEWYDLKKTVFRFCGYEPALRGEFHINEGNNDNENNEGQTSTDNISCDGVLGTFKDDLEYIFKVFKIGGPGLVLVLSTYDYLMAIFSKDAEDLKKSNGKLKKRLILILILFFLPDIINVILSVIDAKNCIK